MSNIFPTEKSKNKKIFSRPPFFPMMMDLNGKKILIVGGGRIAARRAETLLKCGAKITAVSENFISEFPDIDKKIKKTFSLEDINEKFFFIIAATDDREVNKLISDTAHEKKIFVNVCDSQNECDFFFPSLINVENVAVSVCTAGIDSKLTRKLSDRLRKIWAAWIDEECEETNFI